MGNCLVIGASNGLGRALAQELAAAGHRLFLVSSHAEDLEPVAADLRIRFGAHVFFGAAELRDFDPAALRRDVFAALGTLDALYFVAGRMGEENAPPIPDRDLRDLLEINAVAGIRLVNAFLPELMQSPQGHCVGIGSIATTRPRGQNLVYASSKAALEFYFLGLRHALAKSSCRVQFYRVGYMKTRMTEGKRLLLPCAEPQSVARKIAGNWGKDTGLVYAPFWWRIPALAIRFLPWILYKRLQIQ